MEAYEPKSVNSNNIQYGNNSLRLRGLHIDLTDHSLKRTKKQKKILFIYINFITKRKLETV